jgi:uncharacterized linocin/CFP29 family protein
MQKLRHVGLETGQLTDEELRQIDTEIITSVYPALKAREIFAIKELPNAGIRELRHYTATDMGQAIITMNGEEMSDDRTELASSDIKVPVISKTFTLNWRDVLAARHNNMPLDLFEGKNAARQVAEEENKLCISGEYSGWRALGILGLASATLRNTEASAGAWPTNAVTDINDAIAELETDGFTSGPYVLIARSDAVRKLHAAYSTTGMTYYNFLLENKILNAIYSDDSLYVANDGGTDSALVVVPGAENFELAIAQDIIVHNAVLPNMNQFFKVYEVVVPHVKRDTSICEITGLT